MTEGERGVGMVDGGTSRWLAEVTVMPKPGVNDPEGEAILGGLHALGYAGVAGVRAGRLFRVEVAAADVAAAEEVVAQMCDQLLANPVIQTYRIAVRPVSAARGTEGRR